MLEAARLDACHILENPSDYIREYLRTTSEEAVIECE